MSRKLLYVLSNYSPEQGCPYVRDFLPAKLLEEEFGYKTKTILLPTSDEITIDMFPKDHYDWADIVVFCRHYNMDLNASISYLKGRKPIVWETDDDLQSLLEMHHPDIIEGDYKLKNMIKSIKVMSSNADLIIVTTPYLSNRIKTIYKPFAPIEVIYNHIDLDFYQPRNKHKDLRIGWSGGSTHQLDLINSGCINAIIKLQNKYNFTFYLIGITSNPISAYVTGWQQIINSNLFETNYIHPEIYGTIELFDKLQLMKKWNHVPFYPVQLYPSILKEISLDIGLCPVVDKEFNRSRSCNKFYEYAALGTTTAASFCLPYSEEVNYLVCNDEGSWYYAIEQLIKDKKLRKNILKEQQEFVFRERDAKHYAEHWHNIFNGL